jgi:hypothetical protein
MFTLHLEQATIEEIARGVDWLLRHCKRSEAIQSHKKTFGLLQSSRFL